MEKETLLQLYIPMVDYIAGIVGSNCEVVLHRMGDLENSIIAIRNGHISGRKLGGPLTDLGLKLLKEKAYESREILINYPAKTMEGKVMRSSTFFIKDENSEVIGMLCVNIDITSALEASKFINTFIAGMTLEPAEQAIPKDKEREYQEILNHSAEDLITSLIKQTIANFHIPVERMSPGEKMMIVCQIEEKGGFLLKGTVAEVAKYLKTSESTIYRYLAKK